MQAPERESQQVRALFLKNLTLQSRQKCTNICQVLTPIICLLFTIIIRNIAIAKLPSNNDSIFNDYYSLPQKFNNYTFEEYFPELVSRKCQQWYQIEVRNQSDWGFVGRKTWNYETDGLLGKVKNTANHFCSYNITKYFPFFPGYDSYIGLPPLFLTKN